MNALVTDALTILIPATLLLVVVAVIVFLWAVRDGQFRNLETPEILPLLDDKNLAGSNDPPRGKARESISTGAEAPPQEHDDPGAQD